MINFFLEWVRTRRKVINFSLSGEEPEEHVAVVGLVHGDEAGIALQIRVHAL